MSVTWRPIQIALNARDCMFPCQAAVESGLRDRTRYLDVAYGRDPQVLVLRAEEMLHRTPRSSSKRIGTIDASTPTAGKMALTLRSRLAHEFSAGDVTLRRPARFDSSDYLLNGRSRHLALEEISDVGGQSLPARLRTAHEFAMQPL